MARPMPINDEPTYSGCATKRYGPERVTSRDLFRCPAAHTRRSSPASATGSPAAIDAVVGAANQKTATPHRKPSATRKREKNRMASATLRRPQALLHRREHFVHLNVPETHRLQPALPKVMTLTDVRARHGDVARRPRTVPRRPRWSVDADDRRTDSR